MRAPLRFKLRPLAFAAHVALLAGCGQDEPSATTLRTDGGARVCQECKWNAETQAFDRDCKYVACRPRPSSDAGAATRH